MPIWKALEMYSQADRSDRHSIGTTFAEVTEWHLVTKLGGRWCNDLFILVLRFFFSCCILGKSVILHKRRNFIKLWKREFKLILLTPKKILCLKEKIQLPRLVPPNSKYFREFIECVNTYTCAKEILIKTVDDYSWN